MAPIDVKRYNMELEKCFMHERRFRARDSARWALFVALAMTLVASGCAKRKKVKLPLGPAVPRYSETGIASWYGHPYHGRQAANGEIYDMEKMTAAHRTLPFGTIVRVTNLSQLESDRSADHGSRPLHRR